MMGVVNLGRNMTDSQNPAELIWTVNADSRVFQSIRDFHELEGDCWVLEIVDGTDVIGWRLAEVGEIRLRLLRGEA